MFKSKIRDLLFSFNLFFLKLKFKNLKLGYNVSIDKKTNIVIGNNSCVVSDNVVLRSNEKGYQAGMPFATTILIDVTGASVFIGENSRLNGVYVHAQTSIKIGKNCVIAAGVNIMDSNGHVLASTNRTVGRDIPKAIVIGDNVWIGLNATILKGTILGDNSVVSASSVVKGVFPKNSIITGNPGVIIDILNY